ncbi:MAG: cobaltochelatase subunit CobN [Pseudomonadota bacterium]
MHLLVAQSGTIDDGSEPRDIGQTPGDIVVLSAADTELALLSQVQSSRLQQTAPNANAKSLRLANWLQLKHNYSVDLYLEKTLSLAKIVVVRLLGGKTYWPYGLERLSNAARHGDFDLVVLPGDDKPDHALEEFSTVSADFRDQLWGYMTEGGAENADLFLEALDAHLGGHELPPPARPLLKAGIYGDSRTDTPHDVPTACIIFYRALFQSGDLAAIDALVKQLNQQGLRAIPVYVASLRDPVCAETVRRIIGEAKPDVILNTTAFATTKPGDDAAGGILGEFGCPVLQVVLSSENQAGWADGTRGLSARDIAMHVALPEVDGRILTRAISFKADAVYDDNTEHYVVRAEPHDDRARFVAEQAKALSELRQTPIADRKIAILLANYPNRDARLANGVGLDTPASAINVLTAMRDAGYATADIPADGNALIEELKSGATNAGIDGRTITDWLPLPIYDELFAQLPATMREAVNERWGPPQQDPFATSEGFAVAAKTYGDVVVGIQPARGYNIDPKETYHDPALVPPHNYFAFYFWLRHVYGAQAVVHLGKHGNLEWLPGKALALSEACYPEAVLGPLPNIYPFIVNDPGEGSQAKRRTSAVIIDHLMPPMTRAETYGPLRELEVLVDEYFEAAGLDEPRRKYLQKEILATSARLGLDKDFGFDVRGDAADALQAIDNHLCDLKELQIRDGLHILGASPAGRERTDTLVALARVPRGDGEGSNTSLLRALASDLQLADFDPIDCDMAEPWSRTKPNILIDISSDPWRTNGDTVERLELLSAALIAGDTQAADAWTETQSVLTWINETLAPRLDTSGPSELAGLLKALDGRFVLPGPSGAPTRGRPDVLPTGRNFYSLDSRSLPTRAAWELGRKSAERVIERYTQDHGDWPKAMALSAWGTSNMRTGGDDIAQAMALMGVAPTWEPASGRVTGFEIVPLAKLGRPRVDVTFRVSGFFRDAFPAQMDLLDSAARALAELDEDTDDNPIAAAAKADAERWQAQGLSQDQAKRLAGARIFGSKPGAYGAGLQALIDENIWTEEADLADAYLTWGQYTYGGGQSGEASRQAFKQRIGNIDAVLHNQDNREHDILDSDDYYQFEGGLAVTAKTLKGNAVPVYHNDHSRPERPVVRALEEEIGRVVRGRAANPKWIAGIMRHGYKGAFEIAATVDYLYAFAATTGAVGDHHFDALYDAYLGDEKVRKFLEDNNPDALREIAEKFADAIDREMWSPRRNSVGDMLATFRPGYNVEPSAAAE